MHISYNGFIAPYTFQCPRSFWFKNIQKVLIAKPDEEIEDADQEPSRRMRGILLHSEIASYLKHEVDEFQFATDTVEFFRNLPKEEVSIEEQSFFDIDFNSIPCKPEGTYISTRTDCTWLGPNEVIIVDWKFANHNYGIAHYRDELEFFIVGESAKNHEIGSWRPILHFVEQDYSVPLPLYTYNDIARLQQRFLGRIDTILNDKFYAPIPSQGRCGFCPYRSEDTGGSNTCEFTVV